MTAPGPKGSPEPQPTVVVHKAMKECLIIQPHPASGCGLVASRRRRTAEMAAAPETHLTGQEVRAITGGE